MTSSILENVEFRRVIKTTNCRRTTNRILLLMRIFETHRNTLSSKILIIRSRGPEKPPYNTRVCGGRQLPAHHTDLHRQLPDVGRRVCCRGAFPALRAYVWVRVTEFFTGTPFIVFEGIWKVLPSYAAA